ncbi:hypothetical protein EF405_18980 [Cyclobacteriaceae bacterium YHN15]|nr:hypothetical protein EF405_18980 [Cyclobacteriaceae bacterium YHN15]
MGKWMFVPRVRIPSFTVHHNFLKKIRGGKSRPQKNMKNKVLIFSWLYRLFESLLLCAKKLSKCSAFFA